MNIVSNFVLTLKLESEKYQEDILNKRLEISRTVYNSCLNELYKRYNHMKESKEYRKVVKMPKGKERNKQFNDLNKKYGLTEYSLHKYVKPMQKHFKNSIDSFTAQKIATRCFSAFQKLMLHQSNRIYFKKYGEMNSVEGKSNKTGIKFKDNRLLWNELDIGVIIKKNDEYAQKALMHKIKYCRIVRKLIRGKYSYYVQLVLDGVPPVKVNRETGEAKNIIGEGSVGIDIGTQTLAYSSECEVKLLELSPEVHNIEREKLIMGRKLDRQRRANNPDNYNADGTIKKGIRLKWTKSNRYIRTQNQLREIQRKQSAIRKQSHNILANHIISLGDRVLVEKMNYKGLQARSKETTINEKTGRFNKKKRFGKSLANKAPSMFLTILDNKLKWYGKELLKINTAKVKASQYNHIEDECKKKKLSERWNELGEYKIQRDLYSAFVIQNVIGEKLDKIDRESMLKLFDNFIEMHDIEINRIKESRSNLISSMGI